MTFNFLPFPVFLVLSLGSGVLLILFAIKRRKQDPFVLIVSYMTISITSILAGIVKILEKVTENIIYKNYLSILILVLCLSLVMEAIYLYQTKKISAMRKKFVTAFLVFIGVSILVIIVTMILGL